MSGKASTIDRTQVPPLRGAASASLWFIVVIRGQADRS